MFNRRGPGFYVFLNPGIIPVDTVSTGWSRPYLVLQIVHLQVKVPARRSHKNVVKYFVLPTIVL